MHTWTICMLMRALIVVLVMLNLGVAVWWAAQPDLSVAQPRPGPAHGPRLQLLSEMRAPARTAPASPATPVAPTPPAAAAANEAAAQCFTLGPFVDAATAAAARAALQPRVASLHMRQTASGRHGWRVWLPPLADHDTALAMAARIDATGFKDYYVVPNGDDANSIALGRFGNEASARRQQSALQAAGFPAQAEALGAVAQWIDVMTRTSLGMGAMRDATGAPQVRPLDCASLGP